MKFYKTIWMTAFLFTLVVFTSLVSAFPQEIFDGDTVYINDSKAFISATPHTITGDKPVIFEYEAKQFTGNINFVFGYNGDYLKPYRLERWNPQEVCSELNGTQCKTVNWTVINTNNAGFVHFERNLDGKTDWYAKTNIPVVAGERYKYRIWIEAPRIPFGMTKEEYFPNWDSEFAKYDVALYPSSYGADIINANNDGNLYLLDPAVDLTTDLVSYWSFDTNADDDHGSNDGTTHGVTQTGTGCINSNCYSFDGTNDYISTAISMDSRTAFSFSLWVKRDVSGARHNLFRNYDGSSAQSIVLRFFSDDKINFNTDDGTGFESLATADTFTDTTNMQHLVFTYDASSNTKKIYVNNVEKASSSVTIGALTSGDTLDIGAYDSYTTYNWNGLLDEIAFYSVALDTDQVSALYNSGSGNPYPFASESPPFLVYGNNTYNGSVLNVLNVTINGSTHSTTNGTINTHLLHNETALHTFTVRAPNHFPVTETDYNISESFNYGALMFQSELSFACYEFLTGSSLTCTNTTKQRPNANLYNFTRSVSGYADITLEFNISPLDNRTLSFYNFTNANLNITANNSQTGNSLSGFTINMTDLNSDYSDVETVSGDTYFKNLLSGRNYTFWFSKAGYLNTNHTIYNYSSTNYEFSVDPAGGLLINIYQESDSALITEEITIRFINSTGGVLENVTSTGQLLRNDLPSDNYDVSFISTNYTTRTYALTISNVTFQTLNAYLLDAGASSSTIFTLQDKGSGSALEGVTVSIEKLINATWTVVEVLTTDITGKTQFDYTPDTPYRFITSLTDYETRTFILDPILFSTYTIKLEKTASNEDYSDYAGVKIILTPSKYYNEENNTITLIFTSPYGEFVNYGFNASFLTTSVVNSGANAYGGTLTKDLEITGAEIGDRVVLTYYYSINGTTKEYTRTYTIIGTDTTHTLMDENHYGMGILERTLIVTFIVIMVVGMATLFSGAIAGGLMGMLIYGFFLTTGFIEVWIVAISMFMLFIIMAWRSSQ